MNKKILFISNTANFSKFNRPFMRWFKEKDWRVDYASMGEEKVLDCDNQYKISMARSPFNLKNIAGYRELRKIICENDYDIVHCHTPMGGCLARLAARKERCKVIYTAHGFHFFKGAPLFNWLVYYPVEKYLIKYTHALVTINLEDFARAKSLSHQSNVFLINGVGVDLNKFHMHSEQDRKAIRHELGYSDTDFIITCVAEINKNKNQFFLLRQIPELTKRIKGLKILLIGKDNYSDVKDYVLKRKYETYVQFLGYRTDIDKITSMSNICFSASKREGLGINIVEGMACGVPIVVSHNRGHDSLINNNVNGLMFSFSKPKEMVNAISRIYEEPQLGEELGIAAFADSKKYSVDLAVQKMAEIYLPFMSDI
jgi:Glycosyltransferase